MSVNQPSYTGLPPEGLDAQSALTCAQIPARIGVFDSGIGGLTVLKALRARLPLVHFVYLGDTARLPYGTKSPETITEYAVQNIEFLINKNVDEIVVACNSASSVLDAAIPLVRSRLHSQIPITGVIEAGSKRAIEVSQNLKIAVIATHATVAAKAYVHAIQALNPKAVITQTACSLLVSLVEEGWHDGPIVEATIAEYLKPLRTSKPDTLVLGCTHFPLLKKLIQNYVGPSVTLVDSADAIAARWKTADLKPNTFGQLDIFLTDGSAHFSKIAQQFMAPFQLPEIQFVNLIGRPS